MLAKTIEKHMQRSWNFVYEKLVAPCHLPVPADIESEQIKINALRIILGLLVCWRTALIVYSSYYYYARGGFLDCPSEFWISLVCLALSACLTFGFLTPLSVLALLVLYNQMDVALSTMTLGTNLLTLCLFFLLAANSGSRLSIDALSLGNSRSPLYSLTRFLYGVVGFPSREQIRVYCWVLFMAYAITSLGAVSLHLRDGFWQRGETVALMLQNSFLCPFWQTGRALAQQYPWVLMAFSAFACVAQACFQMFMIPLVYTRRGVWFVGLWGAAFAFLSLVLLQISYIPSTEAVLWALIFCPAAFISGPIRRAGIRLSAGSGQLARQPHALSLSATAAALTAFALVVVVAAGHHDSSVRLLRKAVKYLGSPLYCLGLDVPDVFNRLDLSTGKCWYVMVRRDQEGRTTPVPVAFEEGDRGYYHWFDTLYFSNFVPWRRTMGLYQGDLRDLLEPGKPGYAMIRKVVEFDRRLQEDGDRCEYFVTVYASDLSGANKSVISTLSFPKKRGTAVPQITLR